MDDCSGTLCVPERKYVCGITMHEQLDNCAHKRNQAFDSLMVVALFASVRKKKNNITRMKVLINYLRLP